ALEGRRRQRADACARDKGTCADGEAGAQKARKQGLWGHHDSPCRLDGGGCETLQSGARPRLAHSELRSGVCEARCVGGVGVYRMWAVGVLPVGAIGARGGFGGTTWSLSRASFASNPSCACAYVAYARKKSRDVLRSDVHSTWGGTWPPPDTLPLTALA